jgi:RNA polymerase sigma factor (sigma-70 family)
MTALTSWQLADPTDAELASAAAAGDRAAFGGIYDRYADRLHDFCIGMVRDREAAADCVQEVFCTAAVKLTKLRDPDKLRPWLYAIARHEALRHIRHRRRESVSDELPEVQSSEAGPDTLAARSELAGLIAEAAGGLSDRDRSVLELSYRHGLGGPELAEALGVSSTNATKLVSRLRETVERSLGALLVARGAQRNPGGCVELAGILANWDGHFSVLMRKRIARHIDSCTSCERNCRELVNPRALLGVAPILVAAPWWLRGQTLSKVQLTSFDTPISTVTNNGPAFTAADAGYQQHAASSWAVDSDDLARDTQGRHTRRMRAVAALVVIFLVALGLTFGLLYRQQTSIAPSDVTEIQPTPTGTAAPAPPSAPSNQSTGPLPANGRGRGPAGPVSAAPALPPQPAPAPVPVEPPVWVPPRRVPQGPVPTPQTPAPKIHIPTPTSKAPAPPHQAPHLNVPSIPRIAPTAPSVPVWHPRAR